MSKPDLKGFLAYTLTDLQSAIDNKSAILFKHGKRLNPNRKLEILQEIYRLENRMTFFRVRYLTNNE